MDNSPNTKSSIKEISIREAFDKKTILLLSFAVIALFTYFVLEGISIVEIIQLILSANILLLCFGTSFTFISVLIDSYAWKILMRISTINPPLPLVYKIQLSSFSYGLLIPSAGVVEIIMRVSMGKKIFINESEQRNATSGEILSSVVAHKLCGLLSFIPISIFVSIAMLQYFSDILLNEFGQPLSEEFALVFIFIISLISVLALLIFAMIAKSPNSVKSIFRSLLGGLGKISQLRNWAENAKRASDSTIDDFSLQFGFLAQNKLSSSIALVLAFLSQMSHWIAILIILHSIQIPILLDQVAAVNFLAGTVDLIPVGIPGMAGLKEISLAVFLDKGLDLGSTIATAGAILVQLAKFYFVILVGIIVYTLGKIQVTKKDVEEELISIRD